MDVQVVDVMYTLFKTSWHLQRAILLGSILPSLLCTRRMFALRIGVKHSHLGHLQVNRACVFPCLTIAARTIRIVFVLIKNPFYFGQRPRRKWRLSVCKSCCFKNNLCFECNAMEYWKLLWTSCWTSQFFFRKSFEKPLNQKKKNSRWITLFNKCYSRRSDTICTSLILYIKGYTFFSDILILIQLFKQSYKVLMVIHCMRWQSMFSKWR